jgi:ABC-type antimicrobial peptide transport system permease subunit
LKRKDYGIYKAIGYTSDSLILQTAISFMPSIILSVLAFLFSVWQARKIRKIEAYNMLLAE